jgi:hypothetical protein
VSLSRLSPRNLLALGSVCALGLLFYLWVVANNRSGWGVDFNQFYAGSRLAGTGRLYNFQELSKLETHGPPMPTGRLPVEMYGVKIIGWMPYRAAQAVWLAASVLALVLFVRLWPGANRLVMAAILAFSMPAALLLVLGQDTPFWLAAAAAGLWLLDRGRPRLAGVVFALCICKFHLSLGIPILLLAQKRWSALASGAAATALLLAACFAIEGPGWPAQYMEGFRMPVFSPAAYRMLNLHGIAYWTPWPAVVEVALGLVVIALLWVVCRRNSPGMAGAAAAAAGLLVSGHAYANDCALLIPLLAFTLQRHTVPPWLKMWALVVASPLPILVLVLVLNKPYLGQFPIVGFAVAALIWESLPRSAASA